MKRDLVSFSSVSRKDIQDIFALTQWMKEDHPKEFLPLAGKTAALIFEKQSLRTRVSFEVGVSQLGGQSVFLSQDNIGIGSRESVRDIAEMLSGYNDLIIARTKAHSTLESLARYATVPVINALSDLLHPCQILADAYTLHERALLSPGTKITFIGDGNNIVNSWVELGEKLPINFVLACPQGYDPHPDFLARTAAAGMSSIRIVRDPLEAAEDADVLYTDVWVSMGQEDEKTERMKAFNRYQVTSTMLAAAKPDCVVMHCLPAHRGEEITSEVLEGPHSIVREQAINRLHVQRGIMAFLFNGKRTATSPSRQFVEMLE